MTRSDGPDEEKPSQGQRSQGRGDDDLGWGNYLSYGLTVAVGVGLGVWLGGWLDRRNGWSPWGTVVCSMLGLSSGLYLLIRDALRMNKD